jgi:hypothetical protein
VFILALLLFSGAAQMFSTRHNFIFLSILERCFHANRIPLSSGEREGFEYLR